MAKIMLFNVPAYGHVNVTLPVVYELVKRGHQVIYYCGDELKKEIDQTGAAFRPYPDAIPAMSDFSALAKNLANVSVMLIKASETLIPFAIQEIEREQPDLVIYDAITLWARVATQVTNTPSIVTYSVAILEGVTDILDIRTGLYLMATALSKLPGLLYNRYQLVKIYGEENLKFPLFPSVGDLNLVFLSREFQMETSFIDNRFRFVGASIHPDMRSDEPIDLSTDDKPLIYVSLGTVNNQNLEFYQSVIHAFRGFPATLLLSIGQQLSIDDIGEIPDNFLVMNRVPQLQILQHADVFVTHGGMNSVQESLYFGVPMVVVPQQMEQAINGRRVEKLSAGLVLNDRPPYGNVATRDLYHAVNRIMTDPKYKQSAEQQREFSIRSGGYQRAVDEIESFIQTEETMVMLN